MKSGFVALIGRPNVGKSTLMNILIGQDIAITSNKAQTTRKKIQTIYTEERGQIIFMDTPGITRAKNRLGEYMEKAAMDTFNDADVIVWVIEPTTYMGPGEEYIAKTISVKKNKSVPLILVINKVDILARDFILKDIISIYEKTCKFDGCFAVSAITGKNLDELKTALFNFLPEGPLYYDEKTVTLIPLREIFEELIRKELLRSLRDEVPHGVAVQLTRFSKRRSGLYDIEGDIICEKNQHKGIIIGKDGKMLKKISQDVRLEMEKELGQKIYLRLFVKLRKNWRNSELYINSFRYGKR